MPTMTKRATTLHFFKGGDNWETWCGIICVGISATTVFENVECMKCVRRYTEFIDEEAPCQN